MSGNDEFIHQLMKVSVAQICKETKWQGIRKSALECFADVARKYIEEVAFTAATYASVAGRTEANFYDFQEALADLNVSIEDIAKFHEKSDDVPFAKALPTFPIQKPPVRCANDSEDNKEEMRKPIHVSCALPPYPPSRTYMETPVYAERNDTPLEMKRKKK